MTDVEAIDADETPALQSVEPGEGVRHVPQQVGSSLRNVATADNRSRTPPHAEHHAEIMIRHRFRGWVAVVAVEDREAEGHILEDLAPD